MTEGRSALERLFYGPHGLRSGWRIVLYTLLLVPLLAAGALAANALGVARSDWASVVLLTAAPLLAGAVMLAAVDRRRPGALGLALDRAAVRESGVGFAAGGVMLLAAVALMLVAGTVRWVADGGTVPEYAGVLGQSLAFFAVAAAAEEVLFRGYAFQALVQGVGAWPAVVASSALFALAHGQNANVDWLALANIFLAGIMLAVAYLRTRSLWFATAVHLGWNWTMSALLDFPVSGFVRDTPLYTAREVGADWWTGGPFGPEAGIPATLALAAGTAWLLRTRTIGESTRMRALHPLVDDRLDERWS